MKPETAFIRACSTGKPDIVRGLVDGGLSPDTRDKYDLTGLIWAARKGQIEVAKVLFAAGADLEAKDRRGRTAIFHAIAYKRYAFVEYLIAQGVDLTVIDLHNWSPLDVASLPRNDRMVAILECAGAQRKSAKAPAPVDPAKRNSFGAGGAVGGPDLPIEAERIHIQLNTILHKWRGGYTNVIEHFAFPHYVDGSVVRYTQQMGFVGAQPARRSLDWLTVKIGVPESWWRESEAGYKKHLTEEMDRGFGSMIALLKRNNHAIDSDSLLADWKKVKQEFLETPAPPFAAEKQRAGLMAAVLNAQRALAAKKQP
ncbi:MAG: ankyrin repeat domain-containing protein [Terracidiphilus sp.]